MIRECMLCTVRKAEIPFEITSIDVKVYTVEELLYFMQHNPELLDETILNEDLIGWMKEELRLRRLAVSLSLLLQRKFKIREFVLPIFKEVQYPDAESIKVFADRLSELEEMTLPVRMKKKADKLAAYKKYLRARAVYEEVLLLRENSVLSSSFTASVYYEIGRIYAELFQMEEMCAAMKKALELSGARIYQEAYLFAVYLKSGIAALREAAAQEGFSDTKSLEERIEAFEADFQKNHSRDTEIDLNEMVRAYHRETGM